MVVTTELKEPIRSHHDIEKDTAKHHKKASKVYTYTLLVFVPSVVRSSHMSMLSVSSMNLSLPALPVTPTPSTSLLVAWIKSGYPK